MWIRGVLLDILPFASFKKMFAYGMSLKKGDENGKEYNLQSLC